MMKKDVRRRGGIYYHIAVRRQRAAIWVFLLPPKGEGGESDRWISEIFSVKSSKSSNLSPPSLLPTAYFVTHPPTAPSLISTWYSPPVSLNV